MTSEPNKASQDWLNLIDEGKGYTQPELSTFRKQVVKTEEYVFYRSLRKHIKPNDRVLEAGCGWALSSFALAQHGIQTVAMDISPKLIESLKSIQSQMNGDASECLNLKVGDLLKRDELGGPYNVIFNDGTYEHFLHGTDRIHILQNIYSSLAPKGKYIVAVPNTESPFFKWVVSPRIPDMHAFTLDRLQSELTKGGFRVIEIGFTFVNAGFEQWLKQKWMAGPIKAVDVVFGQLPSFLKKTFAAHLYCVAQKIK